jgi:creatinine amidohydrolase/Fe(II)-dependent formamide hydrolase-like protein
MLPHEIVKAREASSCAFVPVSPLFEWHSYHLPVGTDGLIAGGICRTMAERVGGIYFEPLSMGLDSFRSEKQLEASGFDKSDTVFGMRFPELPLSSEYCKPPEMTAAVENRLEAIRGSGFRFVFLVNNHGGAGQSDLLEEIAGKWTSPEFRVFPIGTHTFLERLHEHMKVGGHAGQSETLNLMAFWPELVDLSQIPEGELSVRRFGILHREPMIDAQHNPRHVRLSLANEIRKTIIDGFTRFIEQNCGVKPLA